MLMLDEGKIRQVIMNFADNALYYSRPGTRIAVSLAIEDDDVILQVKDTGIGVPKKEQARQIPSTWPCVGGADGHFNRDDVCHAPNAASYHDRLSLHGAAASGRGILFWKQREYGWRCDDA